MIHGEAANPLNTITKAEARDFVRRVAYILRKDYGVGSSGLGKDVVVCTASGSPLIPIFFYAIVAAGGVYSGASTAFTKNELLRQAQLAEAKLLVCSSEYVDKTIATAKDFGIPLSRVLILDYTIPKRWCLKPADGGRSFPDQNSPMLDWKRLTDKTVLEKTMVGLLFSSGTTGLPKGIQKPFLDPQIRDAHADWIRCCTFALELHHSLPDVHQFRYFVYAGS